MQYMRMCIKKKGTPTNGALLKFVREQIKRPN